MPVEIPGPGKDPVPARDQACLAWLQNLSAGYTASGVDWPVPTGRTAFAALVTAFQSALATSSNPSTRTSPAVSAKNAARTAAVVAARALGRFADSSYRSAGRFGIQTAIGEASILFNSAYLESLGLRVPDLNPSVILPPASAPVLVFLGSPSVGMVKLRWTDSGSPDRRARPAGVVGLVLYADGVPVGTYGRFQAVVAAESGSEISYTGRWINARGQTGPVSTGVTCRAS